MYDYFSFVSTAVIWQMELHYNNRHLLTYTILETYQGDKLVDTV